MTVEALTALHAQLLATLTQPEPLEPQAAVDTVFEVELLDRWIASHHADDAA